jgi:hypothetical protein
VPRCASRFSHRGRAQRTPGLSVRMRASPDTAGEAVAGVGHAERRASSPHAGMRRREGEGGSARRRGHAGARSFLAKAWDGSPPSAATRVVGKPMAAKGGGER